MDRIRLARHLVRAALAYCEHAPWRRFDGDQLIAVHVPDQPLPVFASIIGATGGEHGLCLFRGADAFTTCRRLLATDSLDQVASGSDTLTLGFAPPSDPGPELSALLREAKFAGPIAPFFLAKPPDRRPRPTNRAENELLLSVLEGLLAADAQGLLRPVAPAAHGSAAIWTLRLQGQATRPEVRAKFEEYAEAAPAAPAAAVVLPDDLRRLPKTNASWWIAAPLMPAEIENDDRALHALIVFDATADLILLMHATFRVEPGEVAELFFGVCREDDGSGPRGLPAHVDFDRQALHDALAPALAELSVGTACVPELTAAKKIVEEFHAHEASGRDDEAGHAGASATEPAEDDLVVWKQVDGQLSSLFARMVLGGGDAAKRAAHRYFGHQPEMLETDNDSAARCFGEWFACHWRSSARTRTAAERLLAERSLEPAAQRLLAAHAAANIALYRVAGVTRGEGVELVDVLQGGRVRVHDRSLSESAVEGVVLFAKVYPAGGFTFMAALSAPVPGDTERVLQWLESQGLVLTPEGMERSSHALGRLWGFRAERARTAAH